MRAPATRAARVVHTGSICDSSTVAPKTARIAAHASTGFASSFSTWCRNSRRPGLVTLPAMRARTKRSSIVGGVGGGAGGGAAGRASRRGGRFRAFIVRTSLGPRARRPSVRVPASVAWRATTASRKAARTPRASSARNPAAVVPPGDVTAARSASGPSSPWARSIAEPKSVCSTSCAAIGGAGRRGRPLPSAPRRRASRRPGPSRRARSRRRVAARRRGRRRRPSGAARRRARGGLRSRSHPARSPRRPVRRGRGCSAWPARRAGPARSLRGRDRHAGGDRKDERVPRERVEGRFERRGDVVGLHRDDDDVRIGDRPGRARDDPDLREPGLEVAPAIGVDLRHGEGIGIVATVEQPADERAAHLAATEHRDARHHKEGNARRIRARARGTLRNASHFPERSGPSCTSGPAAASPYHPRRRNTRQLQTF